MQISDFCDRLGLPPARLSAEARQASKGNFALLANRPSVDTLTMELTEKGEVSVAKIQPDGTLEAVTRLKP